MKNAYFLKRAAGRLLALLLLLLPAAVFAQQTVTGTVTDAANAALPGATVLVKGTSNAAAAGADGTYSIQVGDPAAVLVFSAIGTTSQEVTVGNQAVVNVALANDTKQLNDVVVIGYGTSSRKDITGAVTTVKAEDFNQGVLTTPAGLLQGKVAGLNITRSGDPNQRPSVVLRGPSTIRTVNGGVTEPFYVIDGVPGASIDLLAPRRYCQH